MMPDQFYVFTTRVERCDCPPRPIRAKTWHEADELAGRCKHGNKYSTQHLLE